MLHYFDPSKNTVYLDMDGVVADFDGFVVDVIGQTFDEAAGGVREGEVRVWTALRDVDHFYANLRPTEYAHDLVALARSMARVEFLTAVPRTVAFPDAVVDKTEWVRRHFGDDVPVRFGPYSTDKWMHAKPGDILVDDRGTNVVDWINKGMGIGILHEPSRHEDTLIRLERHATELRT